MSINLDHMNRIMCFVWGHEFGAVQTIQQIQQIQQSCCNSVPGRSLIGQPGTQCSRAVVVVLAGLTVLVMDGHVYLLWDHFCNWGGSH